MIQITRPVAASRKWLRINAGRIFVPGVPSCRMPLRDSQIASSTKPPPAVTTHAISAAHFILPPFPLTGSATELPAPAVCQRGPSVTPEGLGRQPNARRRLAALVLGAVDELDGPVDHLRVEAVGGELLARAVLLDVGREHPVELGVRRERVFVALVLAQLGARRALDRRLRDQLSADETIASIGSSRKSTSRLSASSRASRCVPVEEKRDGIETQWTRSAPSASTASAAVSAESIPPETPTTISRKPFLST